MSFKDNNYYDFLCYVGRIVLPALAVFVSTLGAEVGLPYADTISKVVMAIDVFLNALLQQSSISYYKDKNEEVEYDDHITE